MSKISGGLSLLAFRGSSFCARVHISLSVILIITVKFAWDPVLSYSMCTPEH